MKILDGISTNSQKLFLILDDRIYLFAQKTSQIQLIKWFSSFQSGSLSINKFEGTKEYILWQIQNDLSIILYKSIICTINITDFSWRYISITPDKYQKQPNGVIYFYYLISYLTESGFYVQRQKIISDSRECKIDKKITSGPV